MGKKVVDIDVLDVEKRRVPSKHYVYVILVRWSDGLSLTVFRRYSRFFDLQASLLNQFPIEGGAIDPAKRIIPFLPGKIFFGRSHIKDVALKRLDDIKVYCKSLIQLPAHISECEEVIDFFEVEPDDLDPPMPSQDEGKKRLSLSLSLNSLSKSKNSKEKKAEKISKPKRLDRYIAVAEYEVQAPGEMLLYPGLKVDVLEKSDSGWWFVNSEDEQGWVPSTYLEPEEGEEASAAAPVARAEPGQEENFICIEKFEGASEDEVSLEKGAIVQVLQKNMDGWWLVRYMGREAYAPGTYLKKATSGQALSLVEKSRLSGVQIISSLQDVSTLLVQDKTDKSSAETREEPGRSSSTASAVVKTKSLERGGSLIPPPRQNSVTRVEPGVVSAKSHTYITIEDFEDTVGDGLSFRTGMLVYVKEKTATGWWFVDIEGQEGWVPASFLEPCSDMQSPTSAIPSRRSIISNDEDYEDEDWYDHPDHEPPGVGSEDSTHSYMDMAKRPLPPIPPDEEEEDDKLPRQSSVSPRMAHRPLPSAPGPANVETQAKKSVPVLPVPKKPSQQAVKNSNRMVSSLSDGSNLKSTEDSAPAKQTPTPVSSSGEGSDLAAILKAKFAARASAVADNENGADEIPPTKSLEKTKFQPSLPMKPSGVKKVNGLGAGQSLSEESNISSKPCPPVKSKPLKPPVQAKPSGSVNPPVPGSKPGYPGVQLRPVSKISKVDNGDKTSNPTPSLKSQSIFNNSNKPVPPFKNNVKNLSESFSSSSNPSQKPAFNKPSVPSKPKPATAAKPVVASKPAVSQKVNNLANNLCGKLNLTSNTTVGNGGDNNASPVASASRPVSSGNSVSAVSSNKSYVALYDFTAENEGEISLREGDDLELLDKQGDWSFVRCWDEEGWAPSAYLEKA